MRDQVMHKRIGQRELVEEVFLTGHGSQDIHSPSLALTNVEGNNFVQVPAGTVLGKWKADGLHYPLAFDSAQADVAADNDITVDDVLQFLVGDFAEIEGVSGFRKITAVDYENDTITVDGAAITISEGDTIEVDRTRSFSTVKTTAVAPGTATTVVALPDGDGEKFDVGDFVDIGGAANVYTFEPTVQNDADYEINGLVTLDDGTQFAIDAAFVSDADATAQEIVEGLQTEIEDEDAEFDSEVVAAEDDSVLTITIPDGATVEWGAVSSNLAITSDVTVGLEVTAVSTTAGSNSITVAGDVAVTEDELVVSNPDGEYKISIKTVNTEELTYTPGNVLVPTRARGRVRESNVRGLTPTAKTELAGLITFDPRLL